MEENFRQAVDRFPLLACSWASAGCKRENSQSAGPSSASALRGRRRSLIDHVGVEPVEEIPPHIMQFVVSARLDDVRNLATQTARHRRKCRRGFLRQEHVRPGDDGTLGGRAGGVG